MAQTTTATTNFSAMLQVLIRKELEQELLPTLPHLQDTGAFVKATFVKGTNSTMRFLRIPFIAAESDANIIGHVAGTAPWLTEGVAPTAQALAFGNEEFTAYQAGQRVELTDLAMDTNPEDLLAAASVRVARLAAETIDSYVGQVQAAGANVIYGGTATSRVTVSATMTLTGTLLRRAVQGMKLDSIPRFGDGTYHAIVSPAVVFDFEESDALGGWKAIGQYSKPESLLAGELGKYAGVRFLESANARDFPGGGLTGADVYSTVVFGPDFFAFGDWGNLTTHYVAPGGHGDELAQVASIGYKGRFGAMLIDEAGPRYVRIETGATAI